MAERAPLADPAKSHLDLSDFSTRPQRKQDVPVEAIREASEKAGLVSREPNEPKPPKSAPARKGNHRTGRNTPFSHKVSRECNDGFYAICESQEPKWTMGYTLERALAALQRELALDKTGAGK